MSELRCPRCHGALTMIYWGANTYVWECICGRVVSQKEHRDLQKAEHDRELWLEVVDFDKKLTQVLNAVDDAGDSQ